MRAYRSAAVGAAAALLLAAAATAGHAQAEEQQGQACGDDRGVDRCTAEQQRRVRELFGVRSIEEHRAAGDQVRRVFYVDGYGRDLVLIAFVRSPGRDPALWVHDPRREGERPEPLQAPVPQSSWDEVLARSAQFDRSFAPQPPDPEVPRVCVHGWIYTIEAVDRPSTAPYGPPVAPIRRKTESACEDGPGETYAWEVQRTALSLLPPCAALDARQYRNPASMLAACGILHGDRLAAAEVLNRVEAFRLMREAQDARPIAGLFAHETRIDWNGEEFSGHGPRAADFWARHSASDHAWAILYPQRIEGETSDRVRLSGELSRTVDTPGGEATGRERARVEVVWVRDLNRDMVIESATVGPWESDPPG